MSGLSLLAYITDAVILGTYAYLAHTGRAMAFHVANALGCVPLLAVETVTHAYPIMPLTAAFGALGWWGVLEEL